MSTIHCTYLNNIHDKVLQYIMLVQRIINKCIRFINIQHKQWTTKTILCYGNTTLRCERTALPYEHRGPRRTVGKKNNCKIPVKTKTIKNPSVNKAHRYKCHQSGVLSLTNSPSDLNNKIFRILFIHSPRGTSFYFLYVFRSRRIFASTRSSTGSATRRRRTPRGPPPRRSVDINKMFSHSTITPPIIQ